MTMKHLRKIIISAAILLSLVFSGCSGSSSDDSASAGGEASVSAGVFQAGAAIKTLVPSDNPEWYKEVCLGGFGILTIRNFSQLMSARATGVHDKPYARAIVITQGDNTVAFLVMDAAMLSNNVINEITKGAFMKTGIPQENIFVAATHSHSSADLLGYMGGVSEGYRTFLIDACIRTIVNAYEDRSPSRLMMSQTRYVPSVIFGEDGNTFIKNGEEITWVYNRRGWTTLNKEEADAEKAIGLKPNYTHPDVDPTINVLEAVDISTGKTKGVLINYACHPVIVTDTTTKISRDFCGYLVDYVQKRIGAPAIFIQGSQGDVNPVDWEDIGADENNCYFFAKQFGEDIAKQAITSMSDQSAISDDMYISRKTVNVDIDNPLFILLLGIQKSLIDMTFSAKNKAETSVSYIRLGKELQIITYPGEPVTHMGLGILEGEHIGKDGSVIDAMTGPKQIMKAPFKMVTGLTGDTFLYLVPSVEWKNSPDPMPGLFGTPYEEQMSMSLKGVFADECREAANKMINADTGIK
jgi:hypothetical protein